MQRMTAAEWRNQVGADKEEPENPYIPNDIDRMVRNLHSEVTKKKAVGLPQPTEHEIQSAILERLKFVNQGFFWRENSGMVVAEHNGKKRMFRAGIPGIADVMGVFQGFPVAIEVKRPGKKQSLDQKAFQQRFDQCGGIYIVCTDATQVVNQIMAAVAMRKGE